jgi:hypothetical protein
MEDIGKSDAGLTLPQVRLPSLEVLGVRTPLILIMMPSLLAREIDILRIASRHTSQWC